MGLITVVVEMLKGEQRSDEQPTPRAAGFKGNMVDKPLDAPRELLRALAEAAKMYRERIAAISADGTTPFELTSVVAYVPGTYFGKVGLADVKQHVRVASATKYLAPVFADYSYFGISKRFDWQIKKMDDRSNKDGFVDAFVAEPSSSIGVAFEFDGDFLTQTEISERQAEKGSNKVAQPSPNHVRMKYQIVDYTGAMVGEGEITSFPKTMGRGQSDINVPDNFGRVHGKHLKFSRSRSDQVCVENIGSNGAFLVQSDGKAEEITGVVNLPNSGKLIVGRLTAQPDVVVIHIQILGQVSNHANGSGTHSMTDMTDETVSKPTKHNMNRDAEGNLPTKLDSGNCSGRFGVLVLKYSNGEVQKKPIDKLPFTIGRTPKSDAVVKETCGKVSRSHVRIEDIGRSGLHAVSPQETNGCYLGSKKESDGFIWSYSDPNDPNASWLTLGGEKFDDETVQGCLHRGKSE